MSIMFLASGSSLEENPLFALGIVAIFFVAFPVIWSMVCFILGLASGWIGLAALFGTTKATPENIRSVSGMVGFVSYRSTLMVGRSGDDLFLSVFPLFRPGHKPLAIPLSKIVASPGTSMFRRRTKLDLDGRATVRIPSDVWEILVPERSERHPG